MKPITPSRGPFLGTRKGAELPKRILTQALLLLACSILILRNHSLLMDLTLGMMKAKKRRKKWMRRRRRIWLQIILMRVLLLRQMRMPTSSVLLKLNLLFYLSFVLFCFFFFFCNVVFIIIIIIFFFYFLVREKVMRQRDHYNVNHLSHFWKTYIICKSASPTFWLVYSTLAPRLSVAFDE